MFNIFPIGCDSTSSFYGKGKKTAWDTLLCNREYFNSFRSLENAFPPSEELVLQLNRFVCLLYGDKNSKNVNKCRFSLFKSGKCSDDQLPPTCDSAPAYPLGKLPSGDLAKLFTTPYDYSSSK